MRKGLFISFVGAVVLLLVVVFAVRGGVLSEAPAGASASSAFTYQGRLERDGAVVDGACDLRFRLWDAAAAGNQLGGDQVLAGVTIEEGLFTVLLNGGGEFGPDAFNGQPRWLEVAVRCADDPGFTTLGRQELTAAPYAQYALAAPWDGLTGVPAGFADGTDDGLTSVSWEMILNRPAGLDDGDDDTTYTAGEGLMLAGTEFRAQGSPYANVIIVAQSGGDFTSIQAALDSITDATDDNRYLVWVAPGVYSEQVTMKPFVDLEGAGQNLTTITSSSIVTFPQGTLLGASDTEIRSLTIENTGGGENAIGIFNNGVSSRLNNIIVNISGGLNLDIGVWNDDSNIFIQQTTVTATSSANATIGVHSLDSETTMLDSNCKIANNRTDQPTVIACIVFDEGEGSLRNVNGEVYGGYSGIGFEVFDGHATAEGIKFSVSGGSFLNTGLTVWSSWFTGSQVIASASGVMTTSLPSNQKMSPDMSLFPGRLFPHSFPERSSNDSYSLGLYSNLSNTWISNSVLRATNSMTATAAWSATFSDRISIVNSNIFGESHSVYVYDPGSIISIGGSQIAGGPVFGPGQVICAGVYDEDFVFYPDTCP